MKPDSSPDHWQEIELQIQETETQFQAIKQKFADARSLDSDRHDLQIQQAELETQLKNKDKNQDKTKLNLRQRQALKAELSIIQTKLEDIDSAIAAQLITWSSFKEPFWQIVRFSGLGFLLGILVKGCVG